MGIMGFAVERTATLDSDRCVFRDAMVLVASMLSAVLGRST